MPGKRITYLVGNHDADLFFPKVRERIIREWDPEGKFPSERVAIVTTSDRVRLEGGVEIRHGNQLEAIHLMNFEKPLLEQPGSEAPVLNLPWGSFFVLKIINRLKAEREFIDKVRPVKAYILLGLVTDPIFTLKFCFLSAFYFLKTRFVYSRKRRSTLAVTARILQEETSSFLLDLERQAREALSADAELRTVIFGHTHKPMDRIYPDGMQYINTGTWTKMSNLDWRHIGQQYRLTFALIRIEDGQARCELRHWMGEQGPHRAFRG
jgi:UDP-2,3-diacylglucosamine pyrophosphatase LpxH